MDALDLGILRELARDQIVWFGRLDPRLSAAEIARRLHVDRATVSARLHAWERSGFLTGHAIVPSPLLFGARIAGGSLRVDDPVRKPPLLDDLGLVPGVLSAVDHVGPWTALLYAFETREGLERSRRLLARLPGVDEATPCVPFRAPEPEVEPTRLDWRIVRELSTAPRAPMGDVARKVGVSRKTFVRRLERLVEGRALWYLPLLDFTRYGKATIARFVVILTPGSAATRAGGAAAEVVPGLSHLVDATTLLAADEPLPPTLDIGAHVGSVGATEDIQRALRAIDGVVEVEVLFPRRVHLYRPWFDERVESAIRGGDVSARPRGTGITPGPGIQRRPPEGPREESAKRRARAR